MQTLAFGGRGLLWFTYWMPHGVPDPHSWKHSLIAADGTRDPHYDMVRRINADAKAIGDALGLARSVAVFQHGEGATLARRGPAIVPAEGRLTIGAFEQQHRRLALVTNRDYTQPAKTSVAISPPDAAIEVFAPADQTWSRVATDEAGLVPLDLPPGGGILLRW
jgi:hypothetical protein